MADPLKPGSTSLLARLSEQDLARRIAAGEHSEQLLVELYRRFFPLMLRTAALVLGEHARYAEDVAQTVFTQALLSNKAKYLRDPTQLRAYLLASTRHAAIDALRVLHRHTHVPLTALEEEGVPAAPEPEHFLEQEKAHQHFQRVLGALRPDDQEIISWRFLEKRSMSEIAASLRISYAAAAQRLARALARAREKAKEIQ